MSKSDRIAMLQAKAITTGMRSAEPRMSRRERFSYAFVRTLIRVLLQLLTRTQVRGLAHLPISGAAIVVCNHIAGIDPAILVGALPRPIAFMSKAENYRGALKLFMPMVGAFTVRRGAADRQALAIAEQVLGQGRLLGLFPEGTRSRDGALGLAQGGAALLALKLGVPIVPVAITGTPRVFRRRFPWLGYPPVIVTVGAPFWVERLDRPARREDRDRVTGLLMARIAALLPSELRGNYTTNDLEAHTPASHP